MRVSSGWGAFGIPSRIGARAIRNFTAVRGPCVGERMAPRIGGSSRGLHGCIRAFHDRRFVRRARRSQLIWFARFFRPVCSRELDNEPVAVLMVQQAERI